MCVLCIFRSVTVEATYPVEKAKRTLTEKIFSRLRGAFRGAAVAAENERLKREVASLAMVRGEEEEYLKEIDRLRKLLDYKQRLREKWLASPILSKGCGAASYRRTIRIGRGSLDGVQPGMVAAVPDGLVGKVASVTPHTAEVLLVSDPSLKVACALEGENSAKGILSGGTDELLVIRHFTPGADVPPRARVVTSGLGGVFPRGLAVGVLVDVRLDASGLAREGDVSPSVDFAAIEDVFIKIGGGGER